MPALRSMPVIGFADDSAKLEPAGQDKVEIAVWAANRWRVNRLRVTGSGGSAALARQRAETVASLLREQGIEANVDVLGSASLRRQVHEAGALFAKSVVLRPFEE
ncbi:hypothetical protein [Lysobacter sp. Root667]|uniref:hypothetical protein n=1 Tax=Lysobacter sp. Root667 TaxID=1736581 RepID=UPI0012DBFC93|nr:hypothetical protein [Lysobacter sp. Root667]